MAPRQRVLRPARSGRREGHRITAVRDTRVVTDTHMVCQPALEPRRSQHGSQRRTRSLSPACSHVAEAQQQSSENWPPTRHPVQLAACRSRVSSSHSLARERRLHITAWPRPRISASSAATSSCSAGRHQRGQRQVLPKLVGLVPQRCEVVLRPKARARPPHRHALLWARPPDQ
mgnify:CR=1 FL=1|jgi:hypothetical protein